MKKTISGFIAGVLLMASITVFAVGGINNVRIAEDTKLVVLGNQVKTDVVFGVLDGEENGKNYVSARDLAEALGYKVDWNGKTKEILVSKEGKIGLNDPIGDSGETFKKSLKDAGYDIDKMYSDGTFDEVIEFFSFFEIPDEVATLLVVEDYKGWIEGADALFGDFWDKVFN